jgi:2-amino-4-hydroxy-6-hydroxymethyldihydropteridine diphosphokinase
MKNTNKIVFGIGSNLGDRNKNLILAIEKLTKYLFLENLKISSIFKNPAMLPKNAPNSWNIDFLNLALSGNIDMNKFSVEQILMIVKKIEEEIGRKSSERWSPREIDIDILMIDQLIYKKDDLINVPHIGLFQRDFFYLTTQEIEPQMLELMKKKLGL